MQLHVLEKVCIQLHAICMPAALRVALCPEEVGCSSCIMIDLKGKMGSGGRWGHGGMGRGGGKPAEKAMQAGTATASAVTSSQGWRFALGCGIVQAIGALACSSLARGSNYQGATAKHRTQPSSNGQGSYTVAPMHNAQCSLLCWLLQSVSAAAKGNMYHETGSNYAT